MPQTSHSDSLKVAQYEYYFELTANIFDGTFNHLLLPPPPNPACFWRRGGVIISSANSKCDSEVTRERLQK